VPAPSSAKKGRRATIRKYRLKTNRTKKRREERGRGHNADKGVKPHTEVDKEVEAVKKMEPGSGCTG